MSYQRKTEDEYQIHGNYGQGFEEVTCETSWKAAKDTIKEYRENEPGVEFKIIKRRVKKEVMA
jgi:hypothetical protein